MRTFINRYSSRLLLGAKVNSIYNTICEDSFDSNNQFFKVVKKLDAFCESYIDHAPWKISAGEVHVITDFCELSFKVDGLKVKFFLNYELYNGYLVASDDSYDINESNLLEIKDIIVKEIKAAHFKDFREFDVSGSCIKIPLKEFNFHSQDEFEPCYKWLSKEGFLEE